MDTPDAPDKKAPDENQEKPVLKPKPAPGEESSDKKDEPQTITIPGPRTESGKPETHVVQPSSPTSLHSALVANEATPAAQPQYTKVDFGKAGSLKVEAVSNPHNGLGGAEHDVQLRVGPNQTHTLVNVPARYLSA